MHTFNATLTKSSTRWRSIFVASVIASSVALGGCVMQIDEDGRLSHGFLGGVFDIENHPYTPGEDWSGWAKIKYDLVQTDCPKENRGEWLDGQHGWVEIHKDDMTLGFEGFPPLEGTMKDNKADVSGEMIFMTDDGKTRCAVDGNARLNDHQIDGEVTEELSGGTNCSTTGSYRAQLPRAQ